MVGDLFDDVFADLLHLGVVLQEAARDVERDVRDVDPPFEEEQELGNEILEVVRHKDVVAIEFHLALEEIRLVAQFREIEDAAQVDGEIGVEVDPEDGILVIVEDVFVKLDVFLAGNVLGLAVPEGFLLVDLLVLEHDGPGHEIAVAFEDLADLGLLGVGG